MTKELKETLDQQYHEMWDTDWKEIIGSIACVAGIALLGYLWFSIAI